MQKIRKMMFGEKDNIKKEPDKQKISDISTQEIKSDVENPANTLEVKEEQDLGNSIFYSIISDKSNNEKNLIQEHDDLSEFKSFADAKDLSSPEDVDFFEFNNLNQSNYIEIQPDLNTKEVKNQPVILLDESKNDNKNGKTGFFNGMRDGINKKINDFANNISKAKNDLVNGANAVKEFAVNNVNRALQVVNDIVPQDFTKKIANAFVQVIPETDGQKISKLVLSKNTLINASYMEEIVEEESEHAVRKFILEGLMTQYPVSKESFYDIFSDQNNLKDALYKGHDKKNEEAIKSFMLRIKEQNLSKEEIVKTALDDKKIADLIFNSILYTAEAKSLIEENGIKFDSQKTAIAAQKQQEQNKAWNDMIDAFGVYIINMIYSNKIVTRVVRSITNTLHRDIYEMKKMEKGFTNGNLPQLKEINHSVFIKTILFCKDYLLPILSEKNKVEVNKNKNIKKLFSTIKMYAEYAFCMIKVALFVVKSIFFDRENFVRFSAMLALSKNNSYHHSIRNMSLMRAYKAFGIDPEKIIPNAINYINSTFVNKNLKNKSSYNDIEMQVLGESSTSIKENAISV